MERSFPHPPKLQMSLSSGIVPQCFKHILVKPLLEKASLDPNWL